MIINNIGLHEDVDWCKAIIRELQLQKNNPCIGNYPGWHEVENVTIQDIVNCFHVLEPFGLDLKTAASEQTMTRAKKIAEIASQNEDINVWVCQKNQLAIIHQNGGIWNLESGNGVFVLAQNYYPKLISEWYQEHKKDQRVIKRWYSCFHNDNEFVSKPIFYNENKHEVF